MEVQIYNWCNTHPLYTGIIATVFCLLVGAVFARDKVKMFGFNASQFLRRTFGKKVEEKVEEIVDALDEGLHSDNEKK